MAKLAFRLSLVGALCGGLLFSLWFATPSSIEARGVTWSATVWSNPDLAGTSVWSGSSPSVNYAWGAGSPVINGTATGAPVDNFSVRFTTSTLFTTGNYRFTVQVDDGARLYVDGMLLINSWVSGAGLRTLQADYTFSSDSTHTITVEMFDAVGDATILASWAMASGTLPTMTPSYIGSPWYGTFYSGLDLAGTQLYVNSYPPSGLNLDWGQGSPGGTVPVDNFSARFTRTLSVPQDLAEGVYTFYVRADDNYRFYVDATLILDRWDSYAGGGAETVEVTLLNGSHTLKFEYREREVDANLFLTWSPPNAQDPILYPDGSGSTGSGSTGSGSGSSATPVPSVTATVVVPTLNVRERPTTTANVITSISSGATYTVTGRNVDSSWVQIYMEGQTGWVSAKYVTITGDLNTVPVIDTGAPAPAVAPTGVRGRVLGNLRIRSGASTRDAQIGLMPWGAEIDIVGRNRGLSWYQINYEGTTGWSFAPYIRIISGDANTLPYADGTIPTYEPAPATEGVVVQAFGNMRIRSGPSFQQPQIARAIWGTRMQLLERTSDGRWYKVRYGDIEGWSYAIWYRVVQGTLTNVPVIDQ